MLGASLSSLRFVPFTAEPEVSSSLLSTFSFSVSPMMAVAAAAWIIVSVPPWVPFFITSPRSFRESV